MPDKHNENANFVEAAYSKNGIVAQTGEKGKISLYSSRLCAIPTTAVSTSVATDTLKIANSFSSVETVANMDRVYDNKKFVLAHKGVMTIYIVFDVA